MACARSIRLYEWMSACWVRRLGMLTETYDWFSEGHAARNLSVAAALLIDAG